MEDSVALTTYSSVINKNELVIHYDAGRVSQADVEWLMAFLIAEDEAGRPLLVGQTVQVGWSPLMLAKMPDGRLSLSEPDGESVPIKWRLGVTSCLENLARQTGVCKSVGAEPQIPWLSQAGLVCNKLGSATSIQLSRETPENSNSGWFVGCTDDRHDHDAPSNLDYQSLYVIALQHPSIVPLVALPPGFGAVVERGRVSLFQKGVVLREFACLTTSARQ